MNLGHGLNFFIVRVGMLAVRYSSIYAEQMTLAEAKQEFGIRYYWWAKSQLESDFANGFSDYGSFKGGIVAQAVALLKGLPRDEAVNLASAQLRKFHSAIGTRLDEGFHEGAATLGARSSDFFQARQSYRWVQYLEQNGMTDEAEVLWSMSAGTFAPFVGEENMADKVAARALLDGVFDRVEETESERVEARRERGEKVKFASKGKVQRRVARKFKEAFGAKCPGFESSVQDADLDFELLLDGWIMSAHFWITGGERGLTVSHNIYAADLEPNGLSKQPRLLLANYFSSSSYLGQTGWGYVADEDVETTAQGVIDRIRILVEVAPKLLKGISAENISE
jgi:hypothetical protein